jgi:hypothetical protein
MSSSKVKVFFFVGINFRGVWLESSWIRKFVDFVFVPKIKFVAMIVDIYMEKKMVGIMVLIFSYVFKFQSVQCKKLARMHKYVANIHFKIDNDILPRTF